MAEDVTSARIPLIPRGAVVFDSLPAHAVVLERLAPAIVDGIVVARRNGSIGVVLFRGGRLIESYCLEDDRRTVGEAALARIHSWEDAQVSAFRLPDEIVDVIQPMLRGEPIYNDLRLSWTNWDRLLDDLHGRSGTYIVELTTPQGRGVTAIREGEHVVSYTNLHDSPGYESLLDDLAAGGVGSILVLRDPPVAAADQQPDKVSAPPPPPAVQPEPSQPVEREPLSERGVAFSRLFGPPASPPSAQVDIVSRPTPPPIVGSPAVTQLLPELKLIARSRLQRSSDRVEILLEDAALQGRSLEWVANEVRRMSIRGVLPETLDELASALLSAGSRDE